MYLARSFLTIFNWDLVTCQIARCPAPALALALGLLLPGLGVADTEMGVRAAFGGWQQKLDGELRSGLSDVDVEDDLGMDDDTSVLAYFAFEHGVPALPNMRFEYADTALVGDERLARSIEVNGTEFGFSEQVSTEIDLRQADGILYYQLLDNELSLDVGVAARFVDGNIAVASNSAVARADFKGALPMLYAGLRADLPGTKLWLGAQAQGLGYDGDELVDLQVRAGYQSDSGLGTELGWRSMHLRLAQFDDLDQADIDISGPYLMLNYLF